MIIKRVGLIFCTITLGAAFTLYAAETEKLVVTHVMHQMTVGTINNKNETFLSIEPSRSNGIHALHTPDYQRFYGQPLPAARYDVMRMRQIGIDGIALLLCNGHLRSQFAPMIHAYYQAAREEGKIKIYPDSWGDLNRPEGLAAIYEELYQKYPDIWMKRDGRLVVSLWMNYGTNKLPTYQETVDRLFAPLGGREKVFLVLYSPAEIKNNNPEWFAGADAFTTWVSDSYGASRHDLAKDQNCATATDKEWWAPAMPSFMQSRYPHEKGKFIPNLREKLGMTWYRESWLNAIAVNAPVVHLETWNDLTEDSAIMPESNHGEAIYNLTHYYIQLYKTGRQPAVEREQLLLFHHPQVVEGLKLPAGVTPIEGFPASHDKNFNSPPIDRTPPTDYLYIVGILRSSATIKVMLGETVLAEKKLPAGVTSWLIYQPRQLNDPRGLYRGCNPEKIYPHENNDFLVTRLERPFFDSEVYVSVQRNSELPVFFRSHRPVVDAAGRGDMTTVGNVFDLDLATKNVH